MHKTEAQSKMVVVAALAIKTVALTIGFVLAKEVTVTAIIIATTITIAIIMGTTMAITLEM